jgi:hypothetical protein
MKTLGTRENKNSYVQAFTQKSKQIIAQCTDKGIVRSNDKLLKKRKRRILTISTPF